MGIVIESEETLRDLRRLAAHRGVSEERALGDALMHALEKELARAPSGEWGRRATEALERYKASIPAEERGERERQAAEFMDVVNGIQERVSAMPVLDPRSAQEIARGLYDEDGLPR